MFKVGDLVRRKAEFHMFGMYSEGDKVRTVTSVTGESIDLDGDENDFWDADKFELVGFSTAENIDNLVPLIIQWGEDRGIVANSTPLGQSRKTIEEVHELVTACAQLITTDQRCDDEGSLYPADILRRRITDDLKDAIGDVFVTLVMVAACAKLDIHQCVAAAYNDIKDRKGYLRPDGVFVKEVSNDT
jgi:hypothetical protein